MRKTTVLLWFLFFGVNGFSQRWSDTAHDFMRGTLLNGKWHYGPVQKVNSPIDFTSERITIKDSSGTARYRLLKDVVTKQIEEDSCIASLRTGYDKHNIRCMVNLLEFNNGVNVLNIIYANTSYTYYFRRVED